MTTLLHISPGNIIAAGGKFDARKRYLRAATAGAKFPIVKGRTLTIVSNASGIYPSIRYEANGYLVRQTARWGINGPNFSAPSGSFVAAFTMARIT